MGKGRISTIKHEVSTSGMKTMSSSLQAKGRTRYPGTGITFLPYKELTGRFRTGLDPESSLVTSIRDKEERDREIKRIAETVERLEKATGLDLKANSKFWNYSINDGQEHVGPVKLVDGDNWFDFKNPFNEINFSWLSVHPRIASSLEAYQRGDYPSETQFYVYNEDIENERAFSRKKQINSAIIKLDDMSPDRRKQIARLLALPVTDSTKEAQVYNLIDGLLKQTDFKEGKHRGASTVNMFLQFADLKPGTLEVKDAIEQAVIYNIYRKKESGRIYEGDLLVSESQEELVTKLLDVENQEMLLALNSKLKAKKIASA